MIKKLAIITCVLLICSCSKDENIASNEDRPMTSDVVTFDINSSAKWSPDVIEGMDAPAGSVETKAAYTRSESLPMECEGYEGTQIFMYMIEEDNPDMVHVQSVETRAEGSGPSLGVYAFKSDSDTYDPSDEATDAVFMDNVDLSTYGTDASPYVYWPGNGTWLKFFAYTPYHTSVEGLTVVTSGNQAKFSYTVPSDDLSKQCDIMDGSSDLIAGNVTGVVSFSLKHILSQIRVKAGTLDEGVINSISFRNIYNEGDRIMASESWTVNSESRSDYIQTFDPGIKPEKGTQLGKEMYLLPQTLRDDAMIEIKMTVTSDAFSGGTRTSEYVLTKKLKEFTERWEKDMIYTYVISTPEEVEISVTDEVDGNVKKNLQITNTGLSSAYVRAAISGNWVIPNETDTYDDDIIVADWTDADGTFDWGDKVYDNPASAIANKGWYKSTDGYYYLLVPLERGKDAATLFDTYTLTSSPVAGAVLDLTILVQAVLPADMPAAWPSIHAIITN